MNTKLEFHGSDIEKVCEHYGLKKDDIVNFGANVNPHTVRFLQTLSCRAMVPVN